MLIRKNSSSLLSKLRVQTPKKQRNEESRSQFFMQADAFDYTAVKTEDLVQKIKQQQNQIEKLLNIIQNYKRKICQFSQYQQVIHNFIAQKQTEKTLKTAKNDLKRQPSSRFYSSIQVNTEPLIKHKKQAIFPIYSITILCEKQRQKWINQKVQLTKKTLSQFQDTKSSKLEEKQNIHVWSRSRQKSIYESFLKENKSLLNEQSLLDFNKTISFEGQNNSNQESKISHIQRVPSLQNIRRIQKCMKLLKS